MRNFFKKLFGSNSDQGSKVDRNSLRYAMENTRIEDDLVPIHFSNVGTYTPGSRTKMIKKEVETEVN